VQYEQLVAKGAKVITTPMNLGIGTRKPVKYTPEQRKEMADKMHEKGIRSSHHN
jgi:hypothetical protein